MSNVVNFNAKREETAAAEEEIAAYGDRCCDAFKIMAEPIREMRSLELSSEQIARILSVVVEELRAEALRQST